MPKTSFVPSTIAFSPGLPGFCGPDAAPFAIMRANAAVETPLQRIRCFRGRRLYTPTREAGRNFLAGSAWGVVSERPEHELCAFRGIRFASGERHKDGIDAGIHVPLCVSDALLGGTVDNQFIDRALGNGG